MLVNVTVSISNSSGPYFHLMLLNALMALALACWLLFPEIDWAPLLDLISASAPPHAKRCCQACPVHHAVVCVPVPQTARSAHVGNFVDLL